MSNKLNHGSKWTETIRSDESSIRPPTTTTIWVLTLLSSQFNCENTLYSWNTWNWRIYLYAQMIFKHNSKFYQFCSLYWVMKWSVDKHLILNSYRNLMVKLLKFHLQLMKFYVSISLSLSLAFLFSHTITLFSSLFSFLCAV